MPNNAYQRSAMAAAIAACFPGAAFAAGVARVDFASGNVAAISADGKSRTLAKGSEIAVGETVSTQAGRAQLRFADGAYMSLQPQTEFKVEEFKFSGQAQPSDSIVMSLLKGGMRTITGLIGRNHRDAYRLKTDVATIGIRGTEYSVKYTNSIEVFVADGAVSVENQSGSFTVPGGSGVMVSNNQTPPQQTDQKPVLPPESPAQREEEQQQQQVADPVNPIQESSPVVVPRLTGTFVGNWGAAMLEGLQSQTGRTITMNGEGTLTAFAGDNGEFIDVSMPGAASQATGNDGVMAWGRWVGGIIQGDGPFSGRNLDNEGPLHWLVAMPATNIPFTGDGVYNMITPNGFSASCAGGGCTGVAVDRSIITVSFGTGVINLDMGITVVGGGSAGSYAGQESIGTLNRATGAFSNGFISVSGAGGNGTLFTRGFLAGTGATHAGLAWSGDVFGASGTVFLQGVTAHKK